MGEYLSYSSVSSEVLVSPNESLLSVAASWFLEEVSISVSYYCNDNAHVPGIDLHCSSVIAVISEDPAAVVSGVQSTAPRALPLHPWFVTWYALRTDQSPSREFSGKSH